MPSMQAERTCNECGTPLSPEMPEGLCPKCLLKTAMGSQAGPPAEGGPSLDAPGADALPDPARLAECFPQLEILELLGQGGMGAVYKARQPALDRFVALKILPAKVGNDPGFAERFTREARALAKLSHPNIISVYDFGQTQGLHFFIMEFVDGPNLRQLEQTHKLSAREALQIIPQICEALQYAHDEGVVHRDIKPENVLVDKKGRVKIADFGLAKILGREPKDLRLTGARDVVGTPNYMAPEQVEKPHQVDHRADIYSLGVVFYEMLTGELPLGRFAPPSRKVQVDVRLDEVVLHALEKEPERRYQQASQVKSDVETIVHTHPAPATPQGAAAPSPAWGFSKIAIVGLVLLILLLLAVAGLAGRLWRGPNRVLAGGDPQPDVLLSGTVIDFEGIPIQGARVAANYYGARSDRAPLEAWTDGSGHYELKTWSEEHTLVASAPGYQSRLATLTTSILGTSHEATMDFRLDAIPGQPLPVPPVVVQTVPESGSTDVDAGLTELRVTFSKRMRDKSWSWTTLSEETTLEGSGGEIHYLPDRRTCVLPVKLRPGKTYATWLNSDRFANFQDEAGRPAVPYLLIFRTSDRLQP